MFFPLSAVSTAARPIRFVVTAARYHQETGQEPPGRQPTLLLSVEVAALSATAQRVAIGISTTQLRHRGSAVWLQPHDAALPLTCWRWPPLDVGETPEQYLERQVQDMQEQGRLTHFALGPEVPAVVDTTTAAQALGVSPSLVCRWCRERRIPALWNGRDWRITVTDLEKLRQRPRRGRPRRTTAATAREADVSQE